MELFKIFGTIGIKNEEANRKIKETVTQAQQAATSIGKGFNSVGDVFSGIGKTFSKVGTTISGVVTAPMVTLGVTTAKTAIEFLSLKESASTAFKTLLGSADSAQKMLDNLYTFSKTTPFSYDTYLQAGKTLVAMGVSAEECIPYLEGITNAAIATGTGQEGVLNLTQALGRMSSTGKITLETLNVLTYSGIPAIQILANEYGVTTEEMFKMISSSKILADEALPKLLHGMQEGTNGAAGATAAYGGLAKEMKGNLSGALDSLHSKFRNMSLEIWNAEEAYPALIKVIQSFTSSLDVLPKIFESVSLAAVPVLEAISDKLNKLKEYLDSLSPEQLKKVGDVILGIAAAGPTLLIAGKAFETIGGALKGVGSTLSFFGKIDFSGAWESVTKLGKGFVNLVNPINICKSAFSGIQSVIGFLAQKVATLALTFSLNGGGLGGTLAVLQGVLSGVGSAFSSFLATIAPVAAVVGAIIGVFIVLKENWDKVVQAFQNFIANTGLVEKFNQIKAAIQPLWEKIKGLKDLFVVIGTVVLTALQPAIAVLAGLFNGVVSAIAPLLQALGGIIDILAGIGTFIISVFTGDWNTAWESVQKIGDGIVNVFRGLWDAVVGFLGGFVQGLLGWVSSLWEASGLGSFFSNLWTNILTWLTTILTNIGAWFTGLGTSISGWLSGIWSNVTAWWDGVMSWISGIWDTICNAVQVGFMLIAEIISTYFQIITIPFRFIWENCKDTIISVWESIKSAVSSALSWVANLITTGWNNVKNITSTVWNAIKSALTNVWNAIKNFATPIFNSIKNTITNIWNGVKSVTVSVWESIKSAITTAVNAVKNVITNIFNAIKSFVTNVWNSIKSTTSNVWNNIKSSVSNVVNSIKSAVSSAFNSVKSTATSVWNSIKSAIINPINAAKDGVRNAINTMKGFFNFSWSLPKIKLPHFKISGKFSLNPPSVPSFGISWYKKAMEDGMFLNSPTIFGMSPNGTLLGGGEAGSETIVGTESLMEMIQKASNNQHTTELLEKILMYLQAILPELSNRQLVLDTGVIAGALTPEINKNLGTISASMARGRSY